MSKIIVTTIFLSYVLLINAQDINPFESIGKKGKITTLSNGKYTEVHLNDSLQRIGSVIVNMNTGKIIQMLNTDSLYSEEIIDPTVMTRWYSLDPKVKHNESPYASMSNNPIWFGDKDGQDTLMMHRSELQKHESGGTFFLVNFTYIKNGVETEIDLGKQMIMVTNEYWDTHDRGTGLNIDNALTKSPYYKLTYYPRMSNHPTGSEYQDAIRIEGTYGVYIHPWTDLAWFQGCKGVTFEYWFDEYGNIETTKKASIDALAKIRAIHNSVKKDLTGDKFVLKTNSVGFQLPPAEPLSFLKPGEIPNEIPKERVYSTSEVIGTALELSKEKAQ